MAEPAIVCFHVWTGEGGSYDADLVYDDWTEVVADIRAALDHGRQVLIEREFMTQAEYDDGGDANPETQRRLRGQSTLAARETMNESNQ